LVDGTYYGYIGSTPITVTNNGFNWTLIIDDNSYYYSGSYPLIFTNVVVPFMGVGTVTMSGCTCAVSISPSGGFVFGGNLTLTEHDNSQSISPSGGLVFGGDFSLTEHDNSQSISPSNGLVFGGNLTLTEHDNSQSISPSNGLVFGGNLTLTEHDNSQSISPSKGLVFGGNLTLTEHDNSQSISPSKGLVFGGNLTLTEHDNSQSISPSNGLVFGGNPESDSASYYKLSFNGSNQYVNTSAGPSITGAFAISAWINQASTSGIQIIIEQWNGGSGYSFSVNGGTIRSQTTFTNLTGGSITAGTLYHVVISYDGTSTITLYLNGSSVGTTTGQPTPNTASTSVSIGSHLGANSFFDGTIDAVRIYNTSLTSTEVTQLYGSGSGLSTAGTASANLVGWWKFDEGSGTTATDSSSGGHNGTLESSPSYQSATIVG
jgi:hypothetical protein